MPLTQTKVNVVKNTTEGCGCIYRDHRHRNRVGRVGQVLHGFWVV